MAQIKMQTSPQSRIIKEQRHRGQGAEVWHRLKRSKTAIGALIFIAILIFAVVFADFLTPYQYDAVELGNALQLIFAILLLILGVIVAVQGVKKLFQKNTEKAVA